MKRCVVFILITLSLCVKSQEMKVGLGKGIYFVEGLTWEETIKKAKAENKSIFVDCYATWCMPCRAMDKNVYPSDSIGVFMNPNFVSIKVQMDQNVHDNEKVKAWYRNAKMLESTYAINSYPTYLFFNSDGKPIHKAVGYKSVVEFISEATNALNPSKQYYRILANYQPGILDTSELKGLAQSFKNSDKQLAEKLASEYFKRTPKSEWGTRNNILFMIGFTESDAMQQIAFQYLSNLNTREYLHPDNTLVIRYFNKSSLVQDIVLTRIANLPLPEISEYALLLTDFKKVDKSIQIATNYLKQLQEAEVYKKENIRLLTNFTKSSKERGFYFFFNEGNKIDSVMNMKGYARSVAEYIIDWEEVKPYVDSVEQSDNVPWKKIANNIKKKYNKEYSERIILDAKTRLYKYFATTHNRYWAEYIKYNIEKVERFGTDTTDRFQDATLINNFVFDAIFYHSDDKKEIMIGLRWLEGVIRRNPKDGNHMDTYANLLYKAGRRQEAIQWQEKALCTAIEEKQDWCITSIKGNLAKMQKGEPTWIKERIN